MMDNTKRGEKTGDHDSAIDLKPFINFLVVLIPVLMLSAEFSKISTITFSNPQPGIQIDSLSTVQPEQNKVRLTVFVTESTMTIGSNNGFLASKYYKEVHSYTGKNNKMDQKFVEVDPADPQAAVREVGIDTKRYKSHEILLYCRDRETNEVARALYSKTNNMLLVNSDINPVTSLAGKESVYYYERFDRRIPLKPADSVELRPLSAYDDLKCSLMKIQSRNEQGPESRDLIIAATNKVVYDKIIQIMDVAREAGFTNVGISKLRG
jgi:biopolymer transport protein ExbD